MDTDIQQPVVLTDPNHVPDVFASGLGEIDDMDGCYRFVLYARSVGADGAEMHVVAARVIVPHDSLPMILFIAARHVGLSLVKASRFLSGTMH